VKLGLAGFVSAFAEPEPMRRLLVAAEAAGFESVWAGEHVVLPREGARATPNYRPQHVPADTPFLDPLVALAYAAACTSRLRLATGLVVLPQRNPVVLAKQLASLDVLSGGRLIFGYGVGYVEPEMRAVGVPMEGRGSRADEYLGAMLALWRNPAGDFHGRHVRIEGVDAWPKPVRGPEIVVGGHSAAALRRAATHGDGWYGWRLDPEAAQELVHELREGEQRHRVAGRPLEVTVAPEGRVDVAAVERFAAIGIQRLVLRPPAGSRDVDAAISFTTGSGDLLRAASAAPLAPLPTWQRDDERSPAAPELDAT
jgi:probable F420-dependent oxidoreductase